MSCASDAVLGDPSLLEHILLHCPFVTILHAQSVSRIWNVTIRSSPLLQQELFLRPKPPTVNELGSTLWQHNPLLFVAFPAWFAQPRNRYHMPDIRCFEELDWGRDPVRHAAFTRAEASWRRMLPTQPAIRTLEIRNFSHGKKADGLSNDVAYFEDGLRMGVLFDLSEGHISRHVVSSFAVIWPMEEETIHAEVSAEKIDDKANQGRKEELETPPPPPSPPQKPTALKLNADKHALANPESYNQYLDSPLPSPWVIGSLVSTKVREEHEIGRVEGEDVYDDNSTDIGSDDSTDSLCGQNNYGQHATLVLAHVQQVHPGSFPSDRRWKSEGQEPVAIHIGKYRYRDHGGPWKDIEAGMETIPDAGLEMKKD